MVQQLTCILLVEDEDDLRDVLKEALETEHYHVMAVARGMQARDAIKNAKFDVAILDICLPDGSGMDLLSEFKRMDEDLGVIMMTAYADIEVALNAIRIGANDFIKKPFNIDELLVRVGEVLKKNRLLRDHDQLKKQVKTMRGKAGMIGQCKAIRDIGQVVKMIGVSDSSVLITGESGTGKEVVARLLHSTGMRSRKPFVPINCGAIPEELLESELFGHLKGAFTGAVRTMPGRFELANGGVIFLDEIGDMSPKLQVKLLRVLQERTFTPVGGSKEVEIDVQIIAATHRELEEEISAGRFREDLFYRLNVIPVHIPPLRERGDDILLLTEHFMQYFNRIKNASISGLSDETKKLMMRYNWPGNVRELRNIMERISILKRSGQVSGEDLPAKILSSGDRVRRNMDVDLSREDRIDLKAMVDEFENSLVVSALNRFGWNKNQAANFLSMNRTTLVEKIKKKGLSPGPDSS